MRSIVIAPIEDVLEHRSYAMGPGVHDRAVIVATLKSPALVKAFIAEEGLMPKLYGRDWNANARKWKTDNPQKIPTLWDAYNFFSKRNLSKTDNAKTGLITVAIEWNNPQEAASWVGKLVARTNALGPVNTSATPR